MKYKKFILNCLEESSKIALKHFGNVDQTTKTDDPNQVLTQTDLEIGQFLLSSIKDEYPGHSIVDEEIGIVDNTSQYTWVTDPIDGTSNFASGSPLFGTYIGLLKNNFPIAGGLVLPKLNEIYYAEDGKGCFLNNKEVHVTKEKELHSVLVSYTIDSHTENPELTKKETEILSEIILNTRNPRMSGSCFDTAMVIKGAYGAYINQTGKIWDNVAQHILVKEAGGIQTTFFGLKMNYEDHLENPGKNYTFCIASPEIHRKLMKLLKEYE